MATVTPPEKKPETPTPIIVEMFKMRAVHGLLIHPDRTRFDTDKDIPHVKDVWCGHQIEAQKLVIVT